MLKPASCICLSVAGLLCLLSFKTNIQPPFVEGPSPAQTPADELRTFQLEPGLKIQLVAAEPMIEDPVAMSFDADGRLWVVEMRGFMPNMEGEGENDKVGRVSVLEDTNGDGQMDVSKVYLDSLVMPRALALVPHGALVAENGALWLTQDLNDDLKADTKTMIDPNYMAGGLPEHAPNGLLRAMDNWYYNAKSRIRYRLRDGKWQRDSTEFRGQWGISQDDKGRLIYNYNWSQLHADLVPPNYLARNKHHKPSTGIDFGVTLDRRVYPIRATPAVNRGYIPGTLDKEGRLLEFTAACSPLAYRGKALPDEFYGNVFVCEPAGNLIKRNVVEEKGVMLAGHDPHPGREFLASTDERFRPVQLATGPDGALYLADMYRGLIQHGAYMTPYLRDQTVKRDLVKPTNRGRIWRIVPENWQPRQPKHLSKASADALIQELSNPDGWYRDMAQRLLVERNDKRAEAALTTVALTSTNALARCQALWTLDGLGLNRAGNLMKLVTDADPLIRTIAVRLLEPFAKTDPAIRTKLGTLLLAEWEKAPMEQVLQMALTAGVLEPSAAHPLLINIVGKYGESALVRDAALSSLYNQEFAFLQRLLKAPQWQTDEPSKEIFVEMVTNSIVNKRNPAELTALLTQLDAHKDKLTWADKSILMSMSIAGSSAAMKPIKLKVAPALLATDHPSIEAARLASLAALFEWPGHAAVKAATAKKSLLNAEEQKLFASGRVLYLNTCSGCHGTDGAGLARFAPPLIASEWVLGDEKRLALILLHGMEGPIEINKRLYDAPDILPVMPAHSTMDDAAITAILTYIRNEWGNNAGPIGKRLVGTTRVTAQGRVIPWTAKELNKYMVDASTSANTPK